MDKMPGSYMGGSGGDREPRDTNFRSPAVLPVLGFEPGRKREPPPKFEDSKRLLGAQTVPNRGAQMPHFTLDFYCSNRLTSVGCLGEL